MGIDVFKPIGGLKKNKPGAGTQSVIQVPIICTVMNTVDPERQGQIAVYPSENLDKNSNDVKNWLWVNKLSTFFGQTEGISADDDYGQYAGNPSSYGQWNSPPDKGTLVICIFVNGDPNYGYYIGAAPSPETLSMVPAIGSSENVTLNEGEAQSYGGAPRLPTTNLNVNNKDIADSPTYLEDAKPVHSYTASIMQQQGILRDKYRGPISTSATREASSRVGWGVSSPGRPVYEGGFTDEDLPSNLSDEDLAKYRVVTRRGGHSIVLDDGDIIGRDQLIRLRTALGHQILMSDDGQMLSILHSNGQSYIELGKEGTVDIFSTNSINLRTQGDLNLHADETLNLSAKNVNINSSEDTYLNADKQFKQRVGEDYNLFALQNIKMKADSAYAVNAVGQIGLKSDAEIFNEAAKIHLNDGASSLSPEVVEPIDVIMHPDTLFDSTVGWAAALAKLPSITSRAPAHMPWMNANQGADVEVDPSAEGQLPAEPTAKLGNLNENISDLATYPIGQGVTPTSGAGIDEKGAISDSLDKNVTSTVLAGIQDITSDLKTAGSFAQAGVAGSGSTESLILGAFGQTPSQMAAGGILKPGADILVNTLASAPGSGALLKAEFRGIVPKGILPPQAFTGSSGVNSVEQYLGSTSAQAQGVVTTLQKGQKALQTVGAITGKEAPGGLGTVVAGTLTASSNAGDIGKNVKEVTGIINKSTSSGLTGGTPDNDMQGVLNQMASGAGAVVASQLSGAVGGITKALNTLGTELPDIGVGIDLNIGASASSFKSITSSFGQLEAGVPQDLAALAGAGAAAVAGVSAGMKGIDLANPDTISDQLASTVGAGDISGIVSGATSSVTGAVQDIVNNTTTQVASDAIAGAVSGVEALGGSVSKLTEQGKLQNAATQVQRGATASISATVASGVSNIPGGQQIASSVVNNAPNVVNPIADGIDTVTGALQNIGTDAFDGVDVGDAVAKGESVLGDAIGSLGGLLNSVKDEAGALFNDALSPGATAALESALSSLTAGGGSTIKLPTVAINTYDRSTITDLIDGVMGPDIIPRPNLLGQIPTSAVTAVNALKSLRKEMSSDIKALNRAQEDVADKQRALFEARSLFPAGSEEITRAERAYEQAATSPSYLALIQKVASAKETFGDAIPNPTPIPAPTNPFSNIEAAVLAASERPSNWAGASNTLLPTDEEVAEYYNPQSIYFLNNQYLPTYTDNTYAAIFATTSKTYVKNKRTVYLDEPYNTDYTPIISGFPAPENTVESVTGEDIGDGPLTVTDGQGGVGQDVYTDYGILTINNNLGVGGGGGGLKWIYDGATWKLK